MHLDVFLIEALAIELNASLRSQSLRSCYSVSISDLYFEFDQTVIRCQFYNGELFLQFPKKENVQKKNRLTAFQDLVDAKNERVDAVQLDRSFHIVFSEYTLAFLFFGRFASIALYKNNKLVDQFPAKAKSPEVLTTPEIQFTPVDSFKELKATFGFLSPNDTDQFTFPLTSEAWEAYLSDKRNVLPIAINKKNNTYTLGKKSASSVSVYDSMCDAENDYTSLYIASHLFHSNKKVLLRQVEKELKRLVLKRNRLQHQLAQPEKQLFKLKADLLMANLHQIAKNSSEIVLNDFETGEPIKIKLNAKITPQANAERYYKKAKNEYKNRENVEENLLAVSERIDELENRLEAIEQTESYRDLKKFIKEKVVEAKVERLPYKVFMVGGLEVRVGKSAKDNDALIRNHSSPNDLWLHAKGVSGSHVIVRNANNLTNTVLETIASIAAFYSKAKNEQLAAVIYTQKKYIRKPKGGVPGAVKVDKEEVVLVEPKLP